MVGVRTASSAPHHSVRGQKRTVLMDRGAPQSGRAVRGGRAPQLQGLLAACSFPPQRGCRCLPGDTALNEEGAWEGLPQAKTPIPKGKACLLSLGWV